MGEGGDERCGFRVDSGGGGGVGGFKSSEYPLKRERR